MNQFNTLILEHKHLFNLILNLDHTANINDDIFINTFDLNNLIFEKIEFSPTNFINIFKFIDFYQYNNIVYLESLIKQLQFILFNKDQLYVKNMYKLPTELYNKIISNTCIKCVKNNVIHCNLINNPQHLPCIKYLLEIKKHEISKNIIDYASKLGKLDIIKYLIENYDVKYYIKAIENGCEYGHIEILKFLFESIKYLDKSVHLKYDLSKSFKLTSKNGHLNILRCLFTYCKTHDLYVYNSSNLIDIACQYGHFEILKYLIEQQKIFCDSNVLVEACKYNHVDIIKYLIFKHKTNIYIDTLKYLSLHNNLEIIKYICSHKYFHSLDYLPAINNACENGNLEIVDYLFTFCNTISNKHLNVAQYIFTDIIQDSSLFIATQYGHFEIVKYLLDIYLKSNITHAYLIEPSLSIAIKNNHIELVKLLFDVYIKKCINISLKNDDPTINNFLTSYKK